MPIKNGQPNLPVYDEGRQSVAPDYIIKGSTVKMILELGNVWFVGKASFGVTWRVLQVAVLSNHPNGRDTHVRSVRVYAPTPDAAAGGGGSAVAGAGREGVAFGTADALQYASVR